MAYNPFNIFRRNQKTIFAVVTVFIMFTFVLSSGMSGDADFFNWFPKWLGGKGRKGEPLCSLDGTKIYDRDTVELKRQRTLAAKFMTFAAQQTLQGLDRIFSEQAALGNPKFSIYYQIARGQFARGDARMAASILENVTRDPDAKQSDKDAIKTFQTMLSLGQGQAGLAAIPNVTSRNAIEFMIWEKKADRLGIKFTDEDVKGLIQKEFLGQFKSDVEILAALRKEYQGFNLDLLMKSLNAEFRVRAAQTALLGPLSDRGDRTLTAAPVFPTPYDLFEFYRDKTSPTAYSVLAVPAAAFVGQVAATPTDADLQRLFNDRKDFEPDPAKEDPGFREPRKVKVEWASATGEEPYYKKAAEEQLSKRPLAAAFIVPTLGGWDARTVAALAASDPVVREEYETVVRKHNFAVKREWDRATIQTFADPLSWILDTSTVRPMTVAAAFGGGAGATFGNALLPANLFATAAAAAEVRARVKAGLPLFLAGTPGPGMFPRVVGAEVMYRAALPPALPIESARPEIIKGLVATKARDLAVADLKKLQEELAKLSEGGKAKDKGAAAKAYLAEVVKTRGLATGATPEFVSEWSIGDDPALAPLKAVKDKGADGGDPHAAMRGAAPVQFGQKFFTTLDPRTQAKTPATGTYLPEFYPEKVPEPSSFAPVKAEPVFLAWRTAEEPARGVTFQEARPKALEAWKRVKARELAKAEAERIAADLNAFPGASFGQFYPHMMDLHAQLQARTPDPKAQDRVKLFRVDDTAPFQIKPDFTGRNPSGTVQPFAVAPSANIAYPTAEMTTTLLDNRTKPAKTVAVLADQPKDTYYVFVVGDRREREVAEYREHMLGFGGARNPTEEVIRGAYRREASRKAFESVIGLLKKEFDYQESDEQKKKIDDREKRGSDE